MTELDPKEYLTMQEAAKRLKMPRRSVYRIMERLGFDNVSTIIFGRRVVHASMLKTIRAEHAPFGSARRHEIAVESGHKGGTQKGINSAKRARAAKRAGG